jgi:rare lipoprotein A
MFGMTAAHKSLPIPCYVRVTNLANNKSVVLRVNDRGPFHEDRVIDLTYTAAKKLDYHRAGTAKVRVDVINLNDFAPLSVAAVKNDSGAKISGALAGAANTVTSPANSPANNAKVNEANKTNSASPAPLKPTSASSTAAKPTLAPASPIKSPSVKSAIGFTPVYLQVGAFASQEGATILQKKLHSYTKLPIVLMPVEGKKIFRVLIGPIADADEMQALKQTLTEKKLSTPYVVQVENK